MLIGGNPNNSVSAPYSSSATTWDLRSPHTSCPEVPDYPLEIVQGTAALVYKDVPMACGGYLQVLLLIKQSRIGDYFDPNAGLDVLRRTCRT